MRSKSQIRVTKKINNKNGKEMIFEEGELDENVVIRNFRTTTNHGTLEGKTQTHEVAYYNLDVIISAGYKRGLIFRDKAA